MECGSDGAAKQRYISVREKANIVFSDSEPSGYLAVLRGYFDESYKDSRVYAIGGYIAKDRTWRSVSSQWRNRRLRDAVGCYHAADCEDGRQDFKHLSKDQRTQLKTDLIQVVDDHERLGGFGSAVIIEDFHRVRESSQRAKEVLGTDPYFLCFQMLLSGICTDLERQHANPGVSVAFIFEEQKEFSGRAKILYDRIK